MSGTPGVPGQVVISQDFTVVASLSVKSISGPPGLGARCADGQPPTVQYQFYPRVEGNKLVWKQATPRGPVVATGTISADGAFDAVADQSPPHPKGAVVEHYTGKIDHTGHGTMTYIDKVVDCIVTFEGTLAPLGTPASPGADEGASPAADTGPKLRIDMQLWAAQTSTEYQAERGEPISTDHLFPGYDAEYMVTITNSGSSSDEIVFVSDLPKELSFASQSDDPQIGPPPPVAAGKRVKAYLVGFQPKLPNWSCSVAADGHQVTCRWKWALGQGSSARVFLRFHVLQTGVHSTILRAHFNDNSGLQSVESFLLQFDLFPSKALDQAFEEQSPGIYRGVFTLQVVNLGFTDAPGPIEMTDTFDPRFIVIDVGPSPGGYRCDPVGPPPSVVHCVYPGPLAAGAGFSMATPSVLVTVLTDEAARLDYVNELRMNGPFNLSERVGMGGNPRVDLQLHNFGPDFTETFSYQDQVRFALEVTNVGFDPAGGPVTVRDRFPSGLTPVSASGDRWTCKLADELPTAFICTNDNKDTLASGDSLPDITVIAAVTAHPSTEDLTLTYRAVLDYHDANPSNNQDSAQVTIIPLADLGVSISHAAPTQSTYFVPGSQVVYTVGVTNVGTETARGRVRVRDGLPPGLDFVGVDGLGWQCSAPPPRAAAADTQEVECTNQNDDGLSPNQSFIPIMLTATITRDTNNIVDLLYDDNDPTNNVAEDMIRLGPLPDLALATTHSGDFGGGGGGDLDFTIRNVGEGSTVGPTTLHVDLGEGLRFESVQRGSSGIDPGWSCNSGAPDRALVTCTNSSLLPPRQPDQNPDPSVTHVQLRVSVAADAPSTGFISAVVATPGDENQTNDAARDQILLRP